MRYEDFSAKDKMHMSGVLAQYMDTYIRVHLVWTPEQMHLDLLENLKRLHARGWFGSPELVDGKEIFIYEKSQRWLVSEEVCSYIMEKFNKKYEKNKPLARKKALLFDRIRLGYSWDASKFYDINYGSKNGAEGKYVYSMVLKEFLNAKGDFPSIFIITPFVTAKAELLKMFYDKDKFWNDLSERALDINKNSLNYWIRNSIDTVHTFQGKEADTVIFCLGVDSGMKDCGAIRWASSKPNLLNVAATRARYRLLIVGDEFLWKDKQNFKQAHELLQ